MIYFLLILYCFYFLYTFITTYSQLTKYHSKGYSKINVSTNYPQGIVSIEEFNNIIKILENIQDEYFFDHKGSVITVLKENLQMIFGLRSVLLQFCYSKSIKGLSTSKLLQDPFYRLFPTAEYIYQLIFSKKEKAIITAKQIRKYHNAIKIDNYNIANDKSSMYWVAASLIESSVMCHEILDGFKHINIDDFFEESHRIFYFLGLSKRQHIKTYDDFAIEYYNICNSDQLDNSIYLQQLVYNLLFKRLWLLPITYPLYCVNLISLPYIIRDKYMPYHNIFSKLTGYLVLTFIMTFYHLLPNLFKYTYYYNIRVKQYKTKHN